MNCYNSEQISAGNQKGIVELKLSLKARRFFFDDDENFAAFKIKMTK